MRLLATSLFCIMILINSSATYAQNKEAPLNAEQKQALSSAQEEVLRLIVFAAYLKRQGYNIAEITPEVRKKYRSVQISFLAPISAGLAGGAAYWTSQESAKKFESIVNLVNVIIESLAKSAKESWKGMQRSSEAIHLDKALEVSSNLVEDSVRAIGKSLKSLIVDGSMEVSAFGVASFTLGAVSYLSYNFSDESALDNETIAWLTGYKRNLKAKQDQAVKTISYIYGLNSWQEKAFQEQLASELYAEIVRSEFQEEKFDLSIFDVVEKAQILDKNQLVITKNLSELLNIESDSTQNIEKLRDNVEYLTVLAAMLESTLEKTNMDKGTRTILKEYVYNTNKKLKAIESYLIMGN